MTATVTPLPVMSENCDAARSCPVSFACAPQTVANSSRASTGSINTTFPQFVNRFMNQRLLRTRHGHSPAGGGFHIRLVPESRAFLSADQKFSRSDVAQPVGAAAPLFIAAA